MSENNTGRAFELKHINPKVRDIVVDGNAVARLSQKGGVWTPKAEELVSFAHADLDLAARAVVDHLFPPAKAAKGEADRAPRFTDPAEFTARALRFINDRVLVQAVDADSNPVVDEQGGPVYTEESMAQAQDYLAKFIAVLRAHQDLRANIKIVKDLDLALAMMAFEEVDRPEGTSLYRKFVRFFLQQRINGLTTKKAAAEKREVADTKPTARLNKTQRTAEFLNAAGDNLTAQVSSDKKFITISIMVDGVVRTAQLEVAKFTDLGTVSPEGEELVAPENNEDVEEEIASTETEEVASNDKE